MPRKTLEVTVEPKVLIWARKSMGIDIQKVAKRLRVSVDTVTKWELGEKKPTLRMLKELARFYKRPLAVFFLPAPPKEPPLPTDFRVLPQQKRGILSKETRLALRNARRLQSLTIELAKSINRELIIEVGRANLRDNAEMVAIEERDRLSVGIQEQFDWRNSRQAFNEWRKKVEGVEVTKDFYRRRYEEWKVKAEREKIKKKGFGVSPAKKCLLEKGFPFVSLVLETHKQGIITYNDIVDYLSIRLKHLNEIEQLIKGET